MSERCSLDEALALLEPDFGAKAAARIEQAIHTDDHFPLYCDGKVVEAGIAKDISVVPESKNGPADILWKGPGLGWAPRAHKWELDRDAVLALKPQPDTRASVQAELEKALAEERAKAEELQAALQAVTERMEKAEARAESAEAAEGQVEAATDNPQRRKPGPKPDYPLWRFEAAAFAHRFFKKNARMPSAGEVAEHLQIKCNGWEPHPTDIRDLLKLLRPE